MWSGNFKTALSYLRLYKWRSLLTMMGIIIGISSVVTVVSLGEGLKTQVVGQINQLGSDVLTVRSGKLVKGEAATSLNNLNLLAFLNSSTLTAKDYDVIKSLPSVSAAAPLDFLTSSALGNGNEADNIFVMGTSPDFLNLVKQKVQYGNFLDNDPTNQETVVIGHSVARYLFGETNAIGETITVSGHDFIVRGVMAESSGGLLSVGETDFNSAVFMPFQVAKGLSHQQTNIVQILARAKDSHNLDKTINDVNQALVKAHSGQTDFSVLKQQELLGILSSLVNTITTFISAIAAVSLLVGGIGIMDIMLVSVSERTREIGVRKAIGATNGQILNQFLTEGLVLTIVGGLIGVVVALLIDAILRLYTSLHPVINVWIILLAVGVSVSVGILFSIIPALKAARKHPIVALRGE